MIEAGVVIDKEGSPIHWHVPRGRTNVHLPDSRPLWDVLWDNRDTIQGFAHSHPGSGISGPSQTDLTTFAAIEAALGCRLDWWITTSDCLVAGHWVGPEQHGYHWFNIDNRAEPGWVAELRRLSV